MSSSRLPFALWCALSASCLACTSTSDEPKCSTPGGAVVGAADSHCTAATPVDLGACHLDAGALPDSGAGGAGGAAAEEEAATLFGSEGDDDDCKYHVAWTSTPVCTGNGVTFTAVVTNKVDGTPVVGSGLYTEAFLTAVHPAQTTGQTTVEDPPGTYEVGPTRFDASGRWTLRFHLFGDCDDGPASPHSHVAFFVDVP
jgi:hypothetical protein